MQNWDGKGENIFCGLLCVLWLIRFFLPLIWLPLRGAKKIVVQCPVAKSLLVRDLRLGSSN